MKWIIEPTSINNVTEIVIYTKDGISVKVAVEYHWAQIIVCSDEKPEFASEENVFVEVEYNLFDVDRICILSFSEGTRKRIREDVSDIIDDYGLSVLEERGWIVEKREIWLYGLLQVNEL
jgi:hypothetical protein